MKFKTGFKKIYIALIALYVSINSEAQLHDVIFNGEPVETQESISQVTALLTTKIFNGYTYVTASNCTGTLVTPKIVLTAAHCLTHLVKAKPEQKVSMQVSLRHNNSASLVDAFAVKYVVHPDSTGLVSPYDVALIQLDREFPGRPSVQLAAPADSFKNDQFVVAGFGTNHIRELTYEEALKDKKFETLVSEFQKTPNTPQTEKKRLDLLIQLSTEFQKLQSQRRILLKKKMIAGLKQLRKNEPDMMVLKNPNSSICEGDSGGPTFVIRNGKLIVVGVHSGGVNMMCENSPKQGFLSKLFVGVIDPIGLDVFVPEVHSWIVSVIEKWSKEVSL